ncbi:MAG: 3'(2'),5'-bisphosphate nucleotidase CysQ [Lacisediminimonas sp.]|nr:3'(2'),5'-bisphosphate nucleotidase CysQ [Lacisediminimonas sp.]
MNIAIANMQDYLVALTDAAGRAIMRVYASPDLGITSKADASPLTAADLAANEVIVHGLASKWPEIPILSEEVRNQFGPDETPPLYWAVDPLDGTKEFIKRNGEFTVNIALIENGRPVLGAIGAPALDALYIGVVGLGARKRIAGQWADMGVRKPAVDRLGAMRVAQSRSHPSPEVAAFLQQFGQLESREVGSSLKFCLLAAGEADIYPRFGPTCIWDTAAGHAILVAAGGAVVRVSGQALTYAHPGQVLNPHFIAVADAGTVSLLQMPG